MRGKPTPNLLFFIQSFLRPAKKLHNTHNIPVGRKKNLIRGMDQTANEEKRLSPDAFNWVRL